MVDLLNRNIKVKIKVKVKVKVKKTYYLKLNICH